MKMRHIAATLIVGTSLCLVVADVTSQPPMQRGGGPPGGGFPGGGPGGGMFGGFKMSMAQRALENPEQTFDYLARGRGFFLVTDTRSLNEPLTQWAKERGITNGQITREQFKSFADHYRGKIADGSAKLPERGGPGGPPGSNPPGSGASASNPVDTINQWAEAEFKRRDANGDGKLNSDEMPQDLRSDLKRWDTNHDGLIDLSEFKAYFGWRMSSREGGKADSGPSVTTIIEEDLDKKPVIFRAGKLPKELPKWFSELDTDGDGQISMYEWKKGGKEMDDFLAMDRNGDGLLTPEEVLKANGVNGGTVLATSPQAGSNGGSMLTGKDQRGGDRGKWGGFGGGGPPGGSGFWGMKKKPQ